MKWERKGIINRRGSIRQTAEGRKGKACLSVCPSVTRRKVRRFLVSNDAEREWGTDGRTWHQGEREKGDRGNFFISVSANIIASTVVIAAFSAMSEGECGRAPVWQRPNIKIGSTEEREKRRRGKKERESDSEWNGCAY